MDSGVVRGHWGLLEADVSYESSGTGQVLTIRSIDKSPLLIVEMRYSAEEVYRATAIQSREWLALCRRRSIPSPVSDRTASEERLGPPERSRCFLAPPPVPLRSRCCPRTNGPLSLSVRHPLLPRHVGQPILAHQQALQVPCNCRRPLDGLEGADQGLALLQDALGCVQSFRRFPIR